MSQIVTKTLVQAAIKRGKQEMIVAVLPHELPVLRALHRPENVRVLDEEFDVIQIEGSAEAEFGRLCKKYDDEKTGVISKIFVSPGHFAANTDFKVTLAHGELAPSAPQSLTRDDADARKARVKAAKEGKEPAKAKA